VTVKKRGCNFSVKIKVLNLKIQWAFLKFSKIHELKKLIKSGFSIYGRRRPTYLIGGSRNLRKGAAPLPSSLLPLDRIWNVDETGSNNYSTGSRKGASKEGKGQKQVDRVTSDERGENLTVVCAVNATGSYAPPMLIFKRKRMSQLSMAGTPPGSVG